VGTASEYKPPFTYDSSEVAVFHYTDPVEGGFGPLFGTAVLLSAIILAVYYVVARWRDKQSLTHWKIAVALIGVIILTCVVNPISSLARYVPQAYLLAVIPVILLLENRKLLPGIAAYLLLALLFFNTYLVASSYIRYNLKSSATTEKNLQMLALRSRTQPILVHFKEFKSTRVMLNEAGVRYRTTDDARACKTFQRVLPENTTEFCM
jgi:hypothetical protein